MTEFMNHSGGLVWSGSVLAAAALLGTVYIRVDYTVQVKELREALHKKLQESDKGNVEAWELRCEVREKPIEFIQKRYPDALPQVRRSEIQKGT